MNETKDWKCIIFFFCFLEGGGGRTNPQTGLIIFGCFFFPPVRCPSDFSVYFILSLKPDYTRVYNMRVFRIKYNHALPRSATRRRDLRSRGYTCFFPLKIDFQDSDKPVYYYYCACVCRITPPTNRVTRSAINQYIYKRKKNTLN